MASSSPLDHDSSASRSIDPAADLDLLERSRSVIAVDQWLDLGPWWYAPLLATVTAGLTLYYQETNATENRVLGFLALVAGAIIAVHDYRRRSVRLRATPRRAAIELATIVLISVPCLLLVAAWGTAVSSLGYERFVPGYAILAWTLTSVGLLGIRAGVHAIRRQRRLAS